MSDIDKAKQLMEVKDPESEALAALQQEVRDLKKQIRSDFFYFIVVLIIVVDAILFMFLVDGGAAIALAILQLFFLILLADRFDIKYVEIVLARIANGYKRLKGGEDV